MGASAAFRAPSPSPPQTLTHRSSDGPECFTPGGTPCIDPDRYPPILGGFFFALSIEMLGVLPPSPTPPSPLLDFSALLL